MNTVLFDLEGTLLPMDLDVFIKIYLGALGEKFDEMNFDKEKCINGVWAGTKAMYKNNGEMRNEDCFWNVFTSFSGVKREECEAELNEFYMHVFPSLPCAKEKNQNMIEAVKILKDKGYRLVLATNPLFPPLATEARIMWAGLDKNDFELVTNYSNCHYSKPNINYFNEVLSIVNVKAEDCMMVGNDTLEDAIIETIGVPVYLVKDCLIQRENAPFQSTWIGNSFEFLTFVKTLKKVGTHENS